MRHRRSTSDSTHALEAWRRAFGITIDLPPNDAVPPVFDTDLVGKIVGRGAVFELRTGSPQHVVAPAHPDADWLVLTLPLTGARYTILGANERSAALGGMVVSDPRVPRHVRIDAGAELLMVKVNREYLGRQVVRLDRHVTTPPTYAPPLVGLVADYCRLLLRHEQPASEAAGLEFERHLSDLVATALRHPETDNQVGLSTARGKTLQRIKEYVHEHAGERGLSAMSIARAMKVSPSYVHKPFEQESTTVGRFIWSVRLGRVAASLTQSDAAGMTIKEIALGSGFSNAAHFARAFKAAYGVAPSEYRAAASERRYSIRPVTPGRGSGRS